MAKKKSASKSRPPSPPTAGGIVPSIIADPQYDGLRAGLSALLDEARRGAARAVNVILTATYWEVGRRVVEFEQGGKARAAYGDELLKRLAADLTAAHGRGFSKRNIEQMRAFYLGWVIDSGGARARIAEIAQTPSAQLAIADVTTGTFPLSWSHYVRLLSIETPAARQFYETEAIRGAWSTRQLSRQVNSMFYERTALSKNKAAMLTKGQAPKPEDTVTPEEQIRDPLVLEFLGLKNEYAESDLEDALIHHLEEFLLELGGEFTFVGRHRRLRLDDKWFKVDLVFFHRRLRCLVIIGLKIG